MTAAALLKLLGGVRAAIFAGLLVLAAAGAGVQTWRLHSAQTREAMLQAAVADWRAAQTTNLGTIDALRARLQALAAARRAERKQQAEAVARAMNTAQALQRDLDTRNAELEALHARDPEARRWGAVPVPAGVLRQLPGGQD